MNITYRSVKFLLLCLFAIGSQAFGQQLTIHKQEKGERRNFSGFTFSLQAGNYAFTSFSKAYKIGPGVNLEYRDDARTGFFFVGLGLSRNKAKAEAIYTTDYDGDPVVTTYSNALSLTLSSGACRYFSAEKGTGPYIGMDVSVGYSNIYVERRTLFGSYGFSHLVWFGTSGILGVQANLNEVIAIDGQARMHCLLSLEPIIQLYGSVRVGISVFIL